MTRKNRYSVSGSTAVLDVLSPVESMQDLAARIELPIVAALVFVHESGNIQYLYAPSVIYDDTGNPMKVFGNACDSQVDFRPIKVGKEAFTFTVNIKRKNLVGVKTLQGQVIEPDKLSATFNPLKQTDLVAYSVPAVLLIPFGREPIYGLITDQSVLDKIEEKWDADSVDPRICASPTCSSHLSFVWQVTRGSLCSSPRINLYAKLQ